MKHRVTLLEDNIDENCLLATSLEQYAGFCDGDTNSINGYSLDAGYRDKISYFSIISRHRRWRGGFDSAARWGNNHNINDVTCYSNPDQRCWIALQSMGKLKYKEE